MISNLATDVVVTSVLLINFRQTFYPLFLSIILRLPRKDSSLEAVPFEGDDSPLKDIPFLKKRKKKKKKEQATTEEDNARSR